MHVVVEAHEMLSSCWLAPGTLCAVQLWPPSALVKMTPVDALSAGLSPTATQWSVVGQVTS
jgi:hypothetical protein